MKTDPNKAKRIIISEHSLRLSGNMNFEDFMQLMATALLEVMRSTRQNIGEQGKTEAEKKELYTKAENDIYDSVNLAMSNVLSIFAPEVERRPDLTEEAIKVVMAVEDDILKRAAAGDVEAMRIVTGNPDWGKEECEEESLTDAPDAEQN